MAQQDTQRAVLDVLVIGTGFSGVGAGIKLLDAGISNFKIFEKSQGIGGTWYDNTYPGAACDVPSHFYCYSFEPNPNWSRIYSPQAEIQKYIEGCVDKYGLRKHIVHGAKVLALRLIEAEAVWEISFADGRKAKARHVINGGGGLHKPLIPDFPGKGQFTGPAMHTAEWDHSVRIDNKRVAVIGSAASAIQVIPAIANAAKSITVFQRTPNYIVPRGDRDFTAAEKKRFARWPWLREFYRWWIFKRMDLILFPITKKKSLLGNRIRQKVVGHMKDSIEDDELQKALIPTYRMGCKRILVSDDLFSTLNREDVDVEVSAIEAIEPKGVRTANGILHTADVIVYATGYDLDGHMASIEVTGLGGAALKDAWRNGQEAYYGCCVSGFPNYWMVTGPNTGVGTTSVVFMIEQMLDYLIKLISETKTGSMVTVKQKAQDDYNESLHKALDDSVWASGCKSWYINADGKITTLYPHNAGSFRKQMSVIQFADFDFVSTQDGQLA